MLVLPTLPLAEAVPPAVLGETVVLVVAAAVLVLWVLRRLFKLLVFLALVVLIGTVLTSAVGVVEDSWTREAPTWTSSRPNSRSLARAMVREGVRKPPGACAHHIVAGAEPRAAPAREVLFAQRIDINDPANGVFLDCRYHRRLHTIAYYAEVDVAQLRLDGDPMGASWRPPRTYVDDTLRERGDFMHLFGASAIVCSARAVRVLEHLPVAVELLSVKLDEETLTLVNVVERRNCLDHEATRWSRAQDGTPLFPERYSFHPRRLPGSTLFKIPETAAAEVLCHEGALDPVDEFKHAVEYHELTGLRFEELWRD